MFSKHSLSSIFRGRPSSRLGITWLTTCFSCCLLLLTGCSSSDGQQSTLGAFLFEIIIENISPEGSLVLSDGRATSIVLSRAIAAIHDQPDVVFSPGAPARDNGLELFAEDGSISDLSNNLRIEEGVKLVGVGQTPVGDELASNLRPGKTYRLIVRADPGDFLSLVLSFFQSNDLFYSFNPAGIPLFDVNGSPISADLSGLITLYDAGTEVNEEPGLGANQPAFQELANTGTDENGIVRPVADGFGYPAATSVLRVTVNPL